MKNFKTILKFELDNYFKSKSYMISTILICIIAVIVMSFPRFMDAFKSGNEDDSEDQVENLTMNEKWEDEDYDNLAFYDTVGLADEESLVEMFPNAAIRFCDSAEEVKELVKNEEADNGFVIKSLTEYDYYVYNKGVFDETGETFSSYMSMLVKLDYCQKNGLDINEFMEVEYAPITINEEILGKDGESNYWYCYILVILIFMLIIMYGTTIASGITNEKSNRSIEILVTSTDSTALLFGKVLAGAIAAVFQVGLIGVGLLGSYQLNKEYWSIDLSMFLDIPTNVIVTYAIFGIGGFLMYAFLYGALGALVSKIEDLNKTAGTAQMVIMIVYMVTLLSLFNIDGIVMKICSFVPLSSYSAMFARVAMGSVQTWEVVVSAILLYASVIGVGILGGKIFRNSTLRYGNPIKLSNALKNLKKND